MIDELLQVHSTVSFKRLPGRYGQCQQANHHISLDLTQNMNIAKVFLHELIHLLHKDWAESRVLWWEGRIWANLTHEQVELLYKKLYRDNARSL